MGKNGASAGLSHGDPFGGEGSCRANVFRFAGHRHLLSAVVDSRSAGRADVQTAGLLEDSGHAHRRRHAITFDPALRLLLTRVEPFGFRPAWLCRAVNALLVGRIRSEDEHLLSRWLMRIYEPIVRWTLSWKWVVVSSAVAVMAITIPVFLHLGSEFMP